MSVFLCPVFLVVAVVVVVVAIALVDGVNAKVVFNGFAVTKGCNVGVDIEPKIMVMTRLSKVCFP